MIGKWGRNTSVNNVEDRGSAGLEGCVQNPQFSTVLSACGRLMAAVKLQEETQRARWERL